MHEDTLYEFEQDEAMSTIDNTITFEQGVDTLETLLDEDAEMYNITQAADDFYSENGHVDFQWVHDQDPNIIYEIIDGHLKPEYYDI